MSLHNDIMNIPADTSKVPQGEGISIAYKFGHRDARHAAAELALEADATIRELVAALAATRADLFYQLEAKHGAKAASQYPSIVEADAAIAKAKGEAST